MFEINMELTSYLLIIAVFVIYYLLLIIIEKRVIHEPKEIIEKVLAVALVYAGISLIYFSLTGKPLLSGDESEYYLYMFIIGFIALVWAIPDLLIEFKFMKKFMKKNKNNL